MNPNTKLKLASTLIVSSISLLLGQSLYASSTTVTNPTAVPVITQNKAFVLDNGTNSRFMFRGITYQPEQDVDPLSDNNLATIQKLVGTQTNPGLWKQLNINAIRVYQVDPSASHDKVMNFLAQNGIYVLVGTSNTKVGIATFSPQYTTAYKNRIEAVINAFGKYPNTLGFNIGNEVEFPSGSNTLENEKQGAAVIKSAIRDAQTYIKSQVQSGAINRQIPVGTAMLDNPNPMGDQVGTTTIAQYLACNTQASDGTEVHADYMGINNSRYVGPNGDLNAYNQLISDYDITHYSIPVIFTEFEGPAMSSPRDWADVGHLFTTKSQYDQLSGGFGYRFYQKTENRGLINSPTNLTPTTNGGFTNLAKQYKTVSSISLALPPQVNTPIACPANFNPKLVQAGGNTPTGNTSITIKNYATDSLVVVQNGKQIANLTAGSASAPSSTSLKVDNTQQLLIQQPNTWYTVCTVSSNILQDGSTVMDNVSWGNPCNVQ
ncbi:hypothetical protein L3V82_06785 [Thiotrichales bacterium 19S3-7]|nr:hypothetical protein [Thiotrichales bacterium 19S3-7]MCF6801804.1 hypothetical protein [Thiotrichales bacterium 19S3-11]